MEEEDQELKFVCKFCSKRFFSGRSLGGHMRGHLATISARKHEVHNSCNLDLESTNGDSVLGVSDSSHLVLEGGGDNPSYGLRDNPKKSWRVSNPKKSIASKEENGCKECGKQFPSLKALSGHMRSHSSKDKEEHVCKQCGKGFDSMRAMFGHMRHHSKRPTPTRVSIESAEENQSDFEILCPVRKKRSKMRYKIIGNLSVSNNLNPSSNVSEINEEEEAAMCLLMLSRGVRNWDEFNFEYSENSLCEETLQLSKTWKMKKLREKLDSGSGNSLCEKNESEFADLDSGFGSNVEKMAELGVFDDGVELGGDEFKKPELDDGSGIELFDAEIENRSEAPEVKLEIEDGFDQTDSEMLKTNSLKEASFDVLDPEFVGNFCAGTSGMFEDSQKKRKYICRTCNKIFHSSRALGGHRASSHKAVRIGFVVNTESHEKIDETSLLLNTTEVNPKLECNENLVEQVVLKKSKDHECPICLKVFPSGQALGGHKRAHYHGLAENRTKEIVLTEHELPDIQAIFDLNIPAVTLEKEVSDDVAFKPWWVGIGSDHEREALVISN